MAALTASNQVIEDTLSACREAFTADELFQNCAADKIHVTYHQCKELAKLSEECIARGGFYNILSRGEGQGSVLTFFNNKGDLTSAVALNQPAIAKDRKIPKLNWLKQYFRNIGYDQDRVEIKYIHRIIESHIRDGGSWLTTMNNHTIVFTLKMNGAVKSHMEFHREQTGE